MRHPASRFRPHPTGAGLWLHSAPRQPGAAALLRESLAPVFFCLLMLSRPRPFVFLCLGACFLVTLVCFALVGLFKMCGRASTEAALLGCPRDPSLGAPAYSFPLACCAEVLVQKTDCACPCLPFPMATTLLPPPSPFRATTGTLCVVGSRTTTARARRTQSCTPYAATCSTSWPSPGVGVRVLMGLCVFSAAPCCAATCSTSWPLPGGCSNTRHIPRAKAEGSKKQLLELGASLPPCSACSEFSRVERFFFPHNVDFRGRAYPMHPHLNHLGSDLCRGMLEFADAKPLTASGLRWLYIQVGRSGWGRGGEGREGRAPVTS